MYNRAPMLEQLLQMMDIHDKYFVICKECEMEFDSFGGFKKHFGMKHTDYS